MCNCHTQAGPKAAGRMSKTNPDVPESNPFWGTDITCPEVQHNRSKGDLTITLYLPFELGQIFPKSSPSSSSHLILKTASETKSTVTHDKVI